MADVDEKHAGQHLETKVADRRSDEEHLYESDHEVPVSSFEYPIRGY